MSERDELEQAIAALEAQRAMLGHATVDAAIDGLRQKLATLEQNGPSMPPVRGADDVDLYGERRVITAMFADVKGSTALAERIDVETWVEIMNHVLQVLSAEIHRYGGEVDRFEGDGLVAFFGLSTAHEDDAERAVLASLAMQEAVSRYAAELSQWEGIELLLRVGLNTGEVIAAHVGEARQHGEDTAMGRAVAVAARLEPAAEPGTVLVSEDTYRLVAPLFEWQSLGETTVKGVSQPVAVYRPLAHRTPRDKGRGLAGLESPLVGREAEFRALHEAIERLRAGVGGLVTLVGEAGIGKSRLVAEVRRSAVSSQQSGELRWVEGRCLSYSASTAYHLWLDTLRGLLGMASDAPPLALRDALRERVGARCPDRFDEVYPYLAELMSLPLEGAYQGVRELPAETLKAKIYDAVEILVESAARRRPLVFVCEDIHWADPTSLELLERLLALIDRVPLLFICVFRPEMEHSCWRIKEMATRLYRHRHSDLWLDALSAPESEVLVGNLLRIEGLPEGLRRRILDHAAGNPFYVEEILRSLIDGGVIAHDTASGRWQATGQVDEVAIPDTLHGVLMARIDRLQEETKRVLQLAAVIGRVFLYRVLAEIARQGGQLDTRLLTLQREQLIRERARVPEPEYIFKHELTRVAAYNGLLRRERRVYHQQVAEALERLFPDRVEEQAGLLAHHWERAEDAEKAIHYLQQAGEQAGRLFANEEAIAYLSRALALLETLPDTPKRARRELELQLSLGVPLVHTKGHGAPEVEKAYSRALELCGQVGDVSQRFQVLVGLRRFYFLRGELQRARELGEELLTLAQSTGDPGQISWALALHGETLTTLGEFVRAEWHCERGLALCDPLHCRSYLVRYGNAPEVVLRLYQAVTRWYLGYPDQALRGMHDALALAERLSHPWTLAYALSFGASFHQFRREARAAQERAESALQVSGERGFALWSAWGRALRGWALAGQGRGDEGIVQLHEGIAALRAEEALMLLMALHFLAEAYGDVGRVEEALSTLDEGLCLVEESGGRYWEAEHHRLKGELLLIKGAAEAQAEACFRRALEVARRQQARSWELRAATSLARLWQKQGKREEARQMLAEIYGWFTEGLDTADLKEAKVLLEALS